ncbi:MULTISPECIES: MarR family winged helix-turn-helix transcriptional regulator [Actinomycetes]|jgi:DNA-binding MarR family transcriptional regulator|uniref:MarR family winged helix-turn-helix transcriptional regulator n=1 Tax=Actinomycetes TaxID=1760 RepID=UPI000B84ABD2|nr:MULTISPECIES: MarR family transcriptional regulator [Actinomycetes]PWD44554.1 hypothetical protein ACN93_03900 [Gordonia paraffinivorans]
MKSGGYVSPDQLGVLIKETQAVLNQRMDEVLRPLGLSVSQYACLRNLHEEPGITGSELARRTFVSRQSMNVLVQGLERQGLVERAPEPGPRRERGAMLTHAATEILARADNAVSDVVGAMTEHLGQEQRNELHALLSACRDALARESSR